MDLNKKQFKIDVAGKDLKIEISKIAEQATAAVMAYYGGTVVLATIVMGKRDVESSYFPLRVDYEEKFYAAGKILGSRFMRREGRPSEEAVLTGRLIDRSIRPLFDHRIRRDIQVVTTVLSYDGENDPAFVAFIAATTALAISEVPWEGPVGAIGLMQDMNGKIKFNPTNSELAEGWKFNAFVAGTGEQINMIEFEGNETPEAEAIEAFEQAKKEIGRIVEFQEKLVKEIGAPKAEVPLQDLNEEAKKKMDAFLSGKLEDAIYTKDKTDRAVKLGDLKENLKAHLIEEGHTDKELSALSYNFEKKVDETVHKNILESERRPDGRALDKVRDLYSEVGLLERAHGSAIFVRGGTQSLTVTTLGAPGAEQLIESLEFSGKKRFLLHYNFPSFSVGETGPFRGPGRRDIGHGALAEKAVRNLIPPKEEFPYTIRAVSEILSSNGSSSMATVCAVSLSMMDAGVKLKNPAAGIAMGLIKDNKSHKVLTDIQGPEDHYGDMDFKIAGTKNGVTAMQLDTKIGGISSEIVKEVLEKGKVARLHILENMNKTLGASREEISRYAPLILIIEIDPSRIGEVIGPGGKVINGIIERTGAESIDIEDDGKVYITGVDKESAQRALEEVKGIVREYSVGEIVEGKIIKLLDFGAIVGIGSGRDGMIHISEFSDGFVKDINEVAKLGDTVKAKIVKIDNGKIGLSLKGLDK
jgi:polyribonucleotide nucleotidyltransferase